LAHSITPGKIRSIKITEINTILYSGFVFLFILTVLR
jgi:hypothetical protein